MDKIEALRHLRTVTSREAGPELRAKASEALDFLEKPTSTRRWFAVLRVEFCISEEGRVDADYGVVKVTEEEDEALNIISHRRDMSLRSNTTWRTYVIRLVEE